MDQENWLVFIYTEPNFIFLLVSHDVLKPIDGKEAFETKEEAIKMIESKTPKKKPSKKKSTKKKPVKKK